VYLAIKKQECEEAKAALDCSEVWQQLDQKLEEIMGVAETHIVDCLKRFTIADLMKDIELD